MKRSILVTMVVGLALALSAVAATAAPPPVGHYTISATGGATFPLLTARNLVNGTVDDQVFYLSTTGSGLFRLPFPLKFYNRTFQKIAISSNGNVQFGVSPTGPTATTEFNNDCLPSATFLKAAALPFWDDLFFDSNDTSHGFMEGIFLKTTGSAPHRTFAVNWQGHRFSDSGALVLARAVFKEGSQTVAFVYGLNGGFSATIGVQAPNQLSSTQWSCETGTGPAPGTQVVSGQRLTFLHAG
jgi:hypothetical protein